jgi:hypothetical protein
MTVEDMVEVAMEEEVGMTGEVVGDEATVLMATREEEEVEEEEVVVVVDMTEAMVTVTAVEVMILSLCV